MRLQDIVSEGVADLSDADIDHIIEDELPEWKKLCSGTTAVTILLHHSAFDQSVDDLLLMAVAIKYACLAGKEVRVGNFTTKNTNANNVG